MAAPFVMLVDDEKLFIQTTSKRLIKRGIHPLLAYSGEECLEKIKQNENLDVVVLDIKMPGLDGIETLREIKKLFPLIEVIMLTGHATIELAIEGMKQGAFDFLMKPCDMKELVEKLNAASEKKRIHEEKIKDAFKRETLAKYGPFYYA